MKIEQSNRITITGKIATAHFLKGIKKGSEIPAKIVDRPGGNEAILEIGGKRIRAEFLRGVPGNNRLHLKLESNNNNSYIFKLIDSTKRTGFLEKVLDFTVFSTPDFDKSTVLDIHRFLAGKPASLYELNFFLLNRYLKEEIKEDPVSSFLRKIVALGMNKETAADLSLLLHSMKPHSLLFFSFFSFFLNKKEFKNRWLGEKEDHFDEKIIEIIDEINTLNDSSDKEELIKELIFLLQSDSIYSRDPVYGTIDLFDEELHSTAYLGKKNSWLFSFTFSEIGSVDLLANKNDNGMFLSLYADDNQVVQAMEESSDLLKKRFEVVGIGTGKNNNVYINFFNKKRILDKLVEINLYYSKNSEFDITI